jgi:hypothetical protein
VLFAAFPLGYGPAAKAVVLADRCREAGLEPAFVGRGVSFELAARSRGVFAEVFEGGPGDARARSLADGARAVVSVMDRGMAQLAQERSRPLHVVDSLLWMRDQVPASLLGARRYWVQRFGDDAGVPCGVSPEFIGPILASVPPPETAAPDCPLVINLGGFESAASPDRDRRYGEMVLEAFAEAGAGARDAPSATLLASAGTVGRLRPSAERLGVEVRSVAHDEAIGLLARARLVITVPGLTTALESFQLGRPTLFLPPRNFSQWCILKRMRHRGLAPHSTHWEDFGERYHLGERLPESVRDLRMHTAIDELVGRHAVRQSVASLFVAAQSSDHQELAAAQKEFLRSLGEDGTVAVVRDLAEHEV